MRRWRRNKEEDEEDPLTFDELEEDEEEEDEEEARKFRPRTIRITRYEDFDVADDGPSFEELEARIRAGTYKPKASDPWTVHVLYQNLKSLGEI